MSNKQDNILAKCNLICFTEQIVFNIKLGALPQSECWNSGKMKQHVLGYCNAGLMATFILIIKLKWITSSEKTLFHHSTIPLFHDSRKNAGFKNDPLFLLSWRNYETF
jgi:hypothetical protein